MTAKQIAIGARPPKDTSADTWVRQGDAVAAQATGRAETFTARLTIDVTPQLRGRIKVAAFRQGLTVADALRDLLERAFPEAGEGS